MQFIGFYSRVISLLENDRRQAALVAGASAFLGLSLLLQVILFARFVEALAFNRATAAILFAWLLLALGGIGAAVFSAQHAARLAHRLRHLVMARFFQQAVSSSLIFGADAQDGFQRLTGVMLRGADQIFVLTLHFFRLHLVAAVIFVIALPAAFIASWQIALALFGVLAVFASLNVIITRRAFASQMQVESLHEKIGRRLGDSMGNGLIMQAYGRLQTETDDLTATMQNLLLAEYPALNWWTRRHVLAFATITALLFITALLGGSLYASAHVGLDDIIMFAGLSLLLTACTARLTDAVHSTLLQDKSLPDFFALLDAESATREKPDAPELSIRTGQIEFRNLSFQKDGLAARLDDLSLTLMPGERVAFVDNSRKTSALLASLLLRITPQSSGDIVIDNQDIAEVSLSSLRQQIALVHESPGLFHRSVIDNLKVGNPQASQEDIIHAARQAGAHEFIAAKTEGFHTVVAAESFTQEEQQRLAIARALLKKAPVLVVEENGTALPEDTLDALFAGRTVLLLAPSSSTLKRVNRVVVFENGRVARVGTYAEVAGK